MDLWLTIKRESGNIKFKFNNIFEMKIKSKKDTRILKKLKLFESLNISTSYNIC